MAYGLQVLYSDGQTILEVSDRTPRLVQITGVTVPSSGTATVGVTNLANDTNAIAVTENGAVAKVSSTGTVTLYGSTDSSGFTNLRLYLY